MNTVILVLEEVRCGECNRLLFLMSGYATIEIMCPRCKAMNRTTVAVRVDKKPPDEKTDPLVDDVNQLEIE